MVFEPIYCVPATDLGKLFARNKKQIYKRNKIYLIKIN